MKGTKKKWHMRLSLLCVLLLGFTLLPVEALHGEEPQLIPVTVYTDSSMETVAEDAPKMRVSGVPQDAVVSAYPSDQEVSGVSVVASYQLQIIDAQGEPWLPSETEVRLTVDDPQEGWSFWSLPVDTSAAKLETQSDTYGVSFALDSSLSFTIRKQIDLEEYVLSRGYGNEQARFERKMIDEAGNEVEPEQGIYEIKEGGWYRYSFSFYAPQGIPDAGEYVYRMPEGILGTGLSQPLYSPEGEEIGMMESTEDGTMIVLTMRDNRKVHTRGYFMVDLYFEVDEYGFPINSEIMFIPDEPSGGNGASIEKTGEFDTDGNLIWNVKATLPAYDENQGYAWAITDESQYSRSPDTGTYYYPDLRKAEVTLTMGEETLVLHQAGEASADEDIAYFWGKLENLDTQIDVLMLVTRCDSHENCSHAAVSGLPEGWCLDWFMDESTLTICYQDEVANVAYFGYQEGDKPDDTQTMNNRATLWRAPLSLRGRDLSTMRWEYRDYSIQEKRGLNIVEKSYMSRDGTFMITANREMLDLSALDKITITDEMSDNLLYLRGSLQIAAEDADGIRSTLIYGMDYTLTVDEDLHGMVIEILHPGEYVYELTYRASTLGNIGDQYTNSVNVDVFGVSFPDTVINKISPSGGMTQDEYRLSVCKREETLDTPVEGARYGLYADTGELLAEAVTDEQGMISYVGDPSSGFILANNCLYYVQEIEAPFGYALSDTRYWFYYDDSRQEDIDALLESAKIEGAYRASDTLTAVTNHGYTDELVTESDELAQPLQVKDRLLPYEMPETGGSGTIFFFVGGLMMILAGVLACHFRQDHEKHQND